MNGNKPLSSSATFVGLRNGRSKSKDDVTVVTSQFVPGRLPANGLRQGSVSASAINGYRTLGGEDGGREVRNGHSSQALQGKFEGLPILRTKIKQSEALSLGMETEVANGSKVVKNGLKRKNADLRPQPADHISKLPKPLSRSVVSLTDDVKNPSRKQATLLCTSADVFVERSSNTNLATVIVSKGIEMQRVEAKALNNKPSASSFRSHKEEQNKESNKIKRKGTSTERSKSVHKTKTKSAVAETSNLKTTASENITKTLPDANVGQESQSPSKVEPISETNASSAEKIKEELEKLMVAKATEKTTIIGANQNAGDSSNISPPQPPETYKTVKEFLDMPTLPEKKPVPEKTKQLYKSRFWEYVDPKKKESSSKKGNADKQKAYDAAAVKTFMEKQKEIRRHKELKEYQERMKDIATKKLQLQELNEKCKHLVSKSSCLKAKKPLKERTTSYYKEADCQNVSPWSALDNFRKYRNLHNAQLSAVTDILKPTKDGELTGEANKRATLLLQEFEAIVRRECLNVQNQFSSSKSVVVPERDIHQADKAVETTLSLELENCVEEASISSVSTIKSYRKNVLGLHSAATKIQAAYKGYQVRKVMKDANILPGQKNSNVMIDAEKLFRMHEFHNENIRKRRRMSFYRTPEKVECKVKLKAIPLTAPNLNNIKLREPRSQSYIPPPSISSFSPRTPSRPPQVLSPFGISTARPNRSFDEPYPKEAIKKFQAAHASPNTSSKSSKADIRHDINFREFFSSSNKTGVIGATNDVLKGNRGPDAFGTPAPSITDALMEKLRLVAAEKEQKRTFQSGTSLSIQQRSGFADVPYESDFESISSIARPSEKDQDLASHDVSITDDYIGPSSESDVRKRSPTPKHRSGSPSPGRRGKLRSKSKSPRVESSAESTTTVETDVELIQKPDSVKINTSDLTNGSMANESSKTLVSSSVTVSTPSIGNLPIPALNLRYQAEKERLNILDKALQATATHEKNQTATLLQKDEIFKMAKAAVDEQITANFGKLAGLEKDRPQLDSIQLAVMQCHEQATRSVCEMTKWMADMKKSSSEELMAQKPRQDPVDLAVIVCSAVEEVKRISEERRRMRQRNREKDVLAGNKEQRTSVQDKLFIERKDQQLQYPSCSERETPASSYRDSFASDSDLETTDDKFGDSDVDVPSTREVVKSISEYSESKVEHRCTPIPNNFKDTSSMDIIRSVAEKMKMTEDTDESVQESEIIEQVESTLDEETKQKSETEIPEEASLSFVDENENLDSSIKQIEIPISLEQDDGVSVVTEVPEDQSLSSKIIDDELSDVQSTRDDYVERNKTFEEVIVKPESVESPSEQSITSHLIAEDIQTLDRETPITMVDEIAEEPGVLEMAIKETSRESGLRDESHRVSFKNESEWETTSDKSMRSEVEVSGKKDMKALSEHSEVILDDAAFPENNDNMNEKAEEVETIFQGVSEITEKNDEKIQSDKTEEPKTDIVEIHEKEVHEPSIAENLNTSELHDNSYQDSFISGSELSEIADKSGKSETEVSRQEVLENVCEDKFQSESVNETMNFELPLEELTIIPEIAERMEDTANTKNVPESSDNADDDEDGAIPNSETEIPEDVSVSIPDESLESSSKQIILPTEKNTKVPEEQLELENNTKVFEEQSHLIQSEELREGVQPFGGFVENKDDGEEDSVKSLSLQDQATADHVIVDIEENEALEMEAAKILEARTRVENEIRELEAQALASPIAEYLNALELKEKPPPPYSPPPSSESLSYSSRSFFISLQDDKLRDTVVDRVDRMWETWTKDGVFLAAGDISETEEETIFPDEDDEDAKERVAHWANSNFDLLTREAVDEIIRQILHIDESSTSFVDRVRRGPMAVKAQGLKIPKTKQELISVTYSRAIETIPKLLLPEDIVNDETSKRGPVKWTCRPRDVVDEILIEEMIEEEYLWTELWPEELFVKEELVDKIIRDSVREVIRNCEIALNR